MADRWGFGAVFQAPPPPTILKRLTMVDNITNAHRAKKRAENGLEWERQNPQAVMLLRWASECAERANDGG